MLSEHELYQQRLIDRCTKGDRVAQQEIYQLYYKVVYNTCFRILGNRVEAEDAMQEAFLSAFHRLRFFRGEASFSTWLRRIAVNRSIDMLRSQKTRFAEFNEATCGLETDYVDEAVDDENNLKLIEQVKAAMEQLPKGLKVVFSLALLALRHPHHALNWQGQKRRYASGLNHKKEPAIYSKRVVN
jgi:RNA polymerase sigma-70 factor (ECF subfamily)